MGIEHFTAWPSKYANPEPLDVSSDDPGPLPKGSIQLRLVISGCIWRKLLADTISRTVHERGRYDRSDNCTKWKRFNLCGNTIYFGPAAISEIEYAKPLRDALAAYTPPGIVITYYPEQLDARILANFSNIMESRASLLKQALSLRAEPEIILTDGLGLVISLDSFSYLAIETVAYLIAQVCNFAVDTGKARMKPTDGSNPKFQMRSWLLRLGFIGPAFERPRKALLEALEGDSAFFTEEQKKRHDAQRKAKRMNG